MSAPNRVVPNREVGELVWFYGMKARVTDTHEDPLFGRQHEVKITGGTHYLYPKGSYHWTSIFLGKREA